MIRAVAFVAIVALSGVLVAGQAPTQPTQPAPARLEALKRGIAADVDGMRVMTQQMTDMVFSFGELGFQEVETSKYLTGVLEQHGFTIERGVAGIPTAWTARWGSGKPVIALGSDIDDIPQASQKPGVAYHDPIVAGAPGHGEGHNSGLPLQITAALALKQRDGAREAVRHAAAVARRRRGAARRQGLPGARRRLQGRRRLHLRARQRRLRRALGRGRELVGPGVDRIHVHRRDRALGRARPGAAARRSTPSS